MINSIKNILYKKHNDYSDLEKIYGEFSNEDLLGRQLNLPQENTIEITLTASIIIPAWNACATIKHCLASIENSSFNHRYPQSLEVIVVDDGSEDGTWECLSKIKSELNMIAIKQNHYGRTHAMNTGISIAEGDIIISLDADMVLNYFAIEELVKRHQILRNVILIGFRYDVNTCDLSITPNQLGTSLKIEPSLKGDVRLCFDWPGWPENMCVETNYYKNLGYGKRLWMPSGCTWGLPRMVFGALFSLYREDYFLIGGYNERFLGWGWEDSLIGAKVLALGHYLIPIFSASGLHITHKKRGRFQWNEGTRNRTLYEELIRLPLKTNDNQFRLKAQKRITNLIKYKCSGSRNQNIIKLNNVGNPYQRGYIYYLMGRYDDSAKVFANIASNESIDIIALIGQARALYYVQKYDESIECLYKSIKIAKGNNVKSKALTILAQCFAALNRFELAHKTLLSAHSLKPNDREIRYFICTQSYKHIRQGYKFAKQGFYKIAVKCFEAVLIQNPFDKKLQIERERCLSYLRMR